MAHRSDDGAAEPRQIRAERDSAPLGPDVAGAFALLAEMTQDFTDALDIDATLTRALELIVRHLGAEAGSLWLIENDGSELACRASVGPDPITGLRLPVSQGIIGRSVRENLCQHVRDVTRDPNFSAAMDEQSGFRTRSLLCAPMSLADQPIGAVELVNKRSGDGFFAETDIHPLQVLASSAALAIANQRMAASLAEAERVRRELELAAEIQRSLLPASRPSLPVAGINIPARTVSGDFYDFLELEDGCIAFCLGDVSGKGMNAALLMAKTASLFRCLAKSTRAPGRLLGVLNDEICETATRGMFVTMVAGVLEPCGDVRLANAGHEPPLHHTRGGAFAAFPAEAPPLGVLAGVDFPELELSLAGGSLYLCSDGLTEACEGGAALGSRGLERLARRFAAKPLAERVQAIAAEVGRLELRDDLTLLAVGDPEGHAR